MSGDAGKVYFVLYLAVVLELLIIIVERDEAEEHLLRKQKESMKIVESILSQLQSGSGTEGINTRPQDEITLPPSGIDIKAVMGADIKSYRKYIVEVGVTDISGDLKRQEAEVEKEYHERLKKLVELANVEEIEYQIFFSSSTDPENAPIFPNDNDIIKKYNEFRDFQPGQTVDGGDGNFWEFQSTRKLTLDKDATFNSLPLDNLTPETIKPVYPNEKISFKGASFVPDRMPEDSVFFYSEKESMKDAAQKGQAGEFKKRAFVVNFQPPMKAGWYKLRFSSRTNRILGVRSDVPASRIDRNTKVNIGTVQLSVEALEKVRKELNNKLEKYSMPDMELLTEKKDLEGFDLKLKLAKEAASKDENAAEIRGKIDLYGYIVKLLAPGQSINFKQNKGAIEFNVRVITPKPQISEPVVSVTPYVPNFDKVPPAFEFTISPYQKGSNIVEGRVIDTDGAPVARINCTPLNEIASAGVTPPTQGGRQEWRAIVDKELSAGKYKAEITHKLSGKSKTEVIDLEVFPTGLTPSNKAEIDLKMDNQTLYGIRTIINAIPTSGGKIKSNQFRINLTTDKDQQRPPFEGLSMGRDDGLDLTADMNELSLSITWIQQYTNREVVLYPAKTVSIKQEAPKIITNNQSVQFSGTAKKVKIKISNITVTPPNTGDKSGTAKAQIKPKISNFKVNINGYDVSSDPVVEEDNGNYTITLEIAGKLERGEDMIIGEVSCNMTTTAINPLNGKTGDREVKISIPVNYEPETESRRPGGGARPPSGGGGGKPKK